MRRLLSVFVIAVLAACASGSDVSRRFDSFSSKIGTNFSSYDKVHLVPSVPGPEVERLIALGQQRPRREDMPLGKNDVQRKLRDLDENLQQSIGQDATLVGEPGPGVLTIQPILTDLQPNRFEFTERGRQELGSFISFAIGAAAVQFNLYEDGRSVGILKDAAIPENFLNRANIPFAPWETADRFLRAVATNMGALFKEPDA